VVWKLDRLGRDLRHLVNIVHDLTERGIGLKVLTGQGAAIDTTTASGKLVFGIFAALAEFERELISERLETALTSRPAVYCFAGWWSVPRMRIATRMPESAVRAATAATAAGMPKASARTPARRAPTANPPSRQSR
jgi:hypothetical protein